MSITSLPNELVAPGRRALSPTSIFTKISSVFSEAEESIQQILHHSEAILADFQQKSVHIVQQYECDVSKLDEEPSSNFSSLIERNEASNVLSSSRTDQDALKFHFNGQEIFALPPEDGISTAGSSSGTTSSEVKEDKQDESSWTTEKSSSNTSSLCTTLNIEQKHYSREKILCSLTEMKDMELKLQEQLQSFEKLSGNKITDEGTKGEEYQELQLAFEQCQRQNCDTIAAMVNDYRPTRNAKSRLHESKVEKKLKGLGFKFPSIESILKSAELPETFVGNSEIPKLL